MSYNPWPFVIVALGSLGFLANSMAQNDNRFDNSRDTRDERANDRFTDGFSPGRWSEPTTNDAVAPLVVRQDPAPGSRSTADQLDSPFSKSNEQPAAAKEISWNDLARMHDDATPNSLRRNTEAQVDIVDVRPIQEKPRRPPSAFPSDAPAVVAQVAPPIGGNRDRFQSWGRDRVRDQTSTPSGSLDGMNRRNVRPTEEDIRDAQLDGIEHQSKNTSLFRSGDLFVDRETNNSSPSVASTTEPASTNKSSGNKSTGLGSAFDWGRKKIEGATDAAATQRSVPMWLTLGLFLSLPANFFLGWIAMNMHARYQDLLEDMEASESRLDRESRRRRREPREERRPRRSREADEDAFLQGGIEV